MRRVTRRGALAGASATILSGCADMQLPFTGGGGPEDPGADGRQYVAEIRDDVKEVPIDGHAVWKFEATETVQINYNLVVDSSYDVDVFLMNEQGYQNYTQGENFSISEHGSQRNTKRVSKSAIFAPAYYHLVVDNTSVGSTKPPSNASELGVPEAELTLDAWV